VDYLVTQSRDNPTAFMTLVGKVLPLQLAGADGGDITIAHVMKLVGVKPGGS
jgi:hypothetical protein